MTPVPTAAPTTTSDESRIIGICLGLAGSIAINTGNNLQSYGMNKLEMKVLEEYMQKGQAPPPTHTIKIKPRESWTWIIGTCIFVSGSLMNFASFGFAPQMLLASLESVQFVTNVFFGRYFMGRTITWTMYFGTLLTVMGTVLTVEFSTDHSAPKGTVEDLIDLWSNWVWLAYLGFVVVGGLSINAFYKLKKQKQKLGEVVNPSLLALLYAVYSALFGTLSVVFAKILAVLVSVWLNNKYNIWTDWFLYVSLLGWLVLMSVWLFRLNSALSMFDPIFAIPLLQANFIFFAIVSGGIYFQEFNYMSTFKWFGFIPGVIIIFVGISLLSPPDEGSDGRHGDELVKDRLNVQGSNCCESQSRQRRPRRSKRMSSMMGPAHSARRYLEVCCRHQVYSSPPAIEPSPSKSWRRRSTSASPWRQASSWVLLGASTTITTNGCSVGCQTASRLILMRILRMVAYVPSGKIQFEI